MKLIFQRDFIKIFADDNCQISVIKERANNITFVFSGKVISTVIKEAEPEILTFYENILFPINGIADLVFDACEAVYAKNIADNFPINKFYKRIQPSEKN